MMLPGGAPISSAQMEKTSRRAASAAAQRPSSVAHQARLNFSSSALMAASCPGKRPTE
jgi:hypothetical protein